MCGYEWLITWLDTYTEHKGTLKWIVKEFGNNLTRFINFRLSVDGWWHEHLTTICNDSVKVHWVAYIYINESTLAN